MSNIFQKFSLYTVIAVILLIFVGGIVRATGSGMGCPDWPKCFGQWVPPTQISELPTNYQEIYGAKLKGEVEFNVVKTWIEYLNRLLGALIGLFCIGSCIFAYRKYWTKDRRIFYYTLGALVLVLIEGWLGSKVVSTELHPVLVSLHMLLSLIILALLLFALLRSYKEKFNLGPKKDQSFLVIILIFLYVGQILFGTQIREGVDIAQKILGDNNRDLWINEIKGKVIFHGALSVVLLFLSYRIMKFFRNREKIMSKLSSYQLLTVVLSILTGLTLSFLGFPALAQPFHLVLSTISISFLFALYYSLNVESI